MFDSDNTGLVESPVSQNDSKYADYYEMDNENGNDVGTSDPEVISKPVTKPVDAKAKPATEQVSTEDSSPEEKTHTPNWQKRINKQTAKIRDLEEQLKSIQEHKSQQKPLPKYNRENFVDTAEYEAYQDKMLEEKLNQKFMDFQEKHLLNAKRETEDTDFNNSWNDKVEYNFEGDPEGKSQFAQLIIDNKDSISKWHDDIHDYMEGTDFGPRMMQVMFARPDIVDSIARSKPIVRSKILMQLESEIANFFKSTPTNTQVATPTKQITPTKAPAPIGAVGTNSNVLSAEESDNAEYNRYIKNKNRR